MFSEDLSLELIGNTINALGVLMLMSGHISISLQNNKYAFLLSAFGSFLVMIGSVFLQSYPVFGLNLVWMLLSLSAYYDYTIIRINKFPHSILKVIFAIGVISVFMEYWGYEKILFNNISGWCVTLIYLIAYYLFAQKMLSKKNYLIWTTLGFFLIISHLIEYSQYAVMVEEIVGTVVGIIGIIKIMRSE